MESSGLPILSLGDFAWRPIGAAFEACVAKSSGATSGHQQLILTSNQFSYHIASVCLIGDGAQRHFNVQVVPAFSGALLPTARHTIAGAKFPLLAKIHQGVESLPGNEIDISPGSAVAAIGTTPGDILFPSETEASIPPSTGGNLNPDVVDKLHLKRDI